MNSIPSIALARMACRLAERRSGMKILSPDGTGRAIPRKQIATWGPWPASTEYYRIIDRISRGEQP